MRYMIIAAILAIAAVLTFAATRPDTFAVQRSTVIAAAPATLHGLINDLHTLNSWSPYMAKDPNVKCSYAGPAAGPGASFAFDGNKDVGRGSLTITASEAPSQVDMRLDMQQPFEGHNAIRFTLQPQGAGNTQVTWAMHGASPYVAKLLGLFMNMDQMIGKDFEAGLALLKAKAEKA